MHIWLIVNSRSKQYKMKRFQDEAKVLGHQLTFVSADEFVAGVSSSAPVLWYKRQPLTQFPDAVISIIGNLKSNIFEQSLLENMERSGLNLLNPAKAREVANHKLTTLQVLVKAGIPIPKTLLATFPLDFELIERELTYPMVLKPANAQKGLGVMLCENRDHLEDLVGLLDTTMSEQMQILLQELVAESKGRDLRVMVLGDRALGGMVRQGKAGRLASNYAAGGKVTAYDLSPEQADFAVKVVKAVGLQFAGIDLLFNKNGFVVCEVNANPGFEGFESVTGINVPKEIYSYLESTLPSK